MYPQTRVLTTRTQSQYWPPDLATDRVGADDHPGRSTSSTDFLHADRVCQVVKPGTAVRLRYRYRHHTKLTQRLDLTTTTTTFVGTKSQTRDMQFILK